MMQNRMTILDDANRRPALQAAPPAPPENSPGDGVPTPLAAGDGLPPPQEHGPELIGDILADLLVQYEIRFPGANITLIQTPATAA